MSERPIQVGDLVQVVRFPCCSCGGNLDAIFKIDEIRRNDLFKCTCHYSLGGDYGPVAAIPNRIAAPVAWLRRIPPLSELDSTDTKEDLREPA